MLALIYGLEQLAEGDGPGWRPALAIAGGAAAGAVFAHRQRTLADPLLDLRLFRLPGFKAALGSNMVSFFTGFGVLLFIGQYLQLVLGLSPLAAGLWMLPSSAGVIAGSMLTPVLARRAGPRTCWRPGSRSPPPDSGCSRSSVPIAPPAWRCW